MTQSILVVDDEPNIVLSLEFLIKQAGYEVRVARDGDAAGVRSAVLAWARLQWTTGAPRSVGELAAHVAEPLAMELRRLCDSSYGPGGADWDGEGLAKALRSVSVLTEEDDDRPAIGLPPLMPNSPTTT